MDKHSATLVVIEHEIRRAKHLHPGEFHGRHEGYAVLLEEVDELWELVKLNPAKMTGEEHTTYFKKMREEAIQVAAMAVRFAAEVC